MNNSTNIKDRRLVRVLLAGMLLACAFITDAYADVTITIGGNVYGGGKNGAVGTGNYSVSSSAPDDEHKEDSIYINISNSTVKVTDVKVNLGSITGKVFGGGENGRSYGGTSVTVNGGEMDEVFGAGDGLKAHVYGHDLVTVTGGTVNNVYGGGNQAALMGTTTVLLQGGTISGDVYGGSRMANIFGYTYVDIDGARAQNDLIIQNVYGGNDISGNITSSDVWSWVNTSNLTVPFTVNNTADNNASGKIDNTWNAFIHSSASVSTPAKNIFIGKLYGGGNGDYGTDSNGDGLYDDGGLYAGKSMPIIEKVYLQIEGGNFGYLLGGGNNATVTKRTDIYINNTSDPVQLTQDQVTATGISETAFTVNSGTYTAKNQFDGVFGGNDRADMAIRPNWYLNSASINNLYSGGNAGRMTYYEETGGVKKGGIILELNSANLTVNNVFGGCRKNDVRPLNNGEDATFDAEFFDGIEFPANYSARILIKAGNINNVYGGNDVSGIVYGGNALEILSTIKENVYGGGNGNYPYTDKTTSFTEHPDYADYLFAAGADPIASMNNFRPNAESVRLHVAGTSDKRTYIGGELYLGGNSATLKTNKQNASATLIIGAYVTADQVFLGSNGINMKAASMLDHYKDDTFSSVVLDDDDDLSEYMEGADVSIMPVVMFDNMVGKEYTTYIGAFHVGGNAGSMTVPGTITMNFEHPITIYNRVVGGSNDAKVTFTNGNNTYTHDGGILTQVQNAPKVILNFDNGTDGGLKLLPKILTNTAGEYSMAWNTEEIGGKTYLKGGNIYGGCYTSGIIDGSVEINLNTSFYTDNDIFKYSTTTTTQVPVLDPNTNEPVLDPETSEPLYEENVTVTWTDNSNLGITKDDQLYVFSEALSVYGGGYGLNTTIKGNTNINLKSGNILKVFGGGSQGVVDNNTTINQAGGTAGKIYGGGFKGLVSGNTRVNLDGGNVIDAFAGACAADIDGYAQMFMGTGAGNVVNSTPTPGMTTVSNNVYGGNDYGGNINGYYIATTGNNADVTAPVSMIYKYDSTADTAAVLRTSTYVEYRLGKVNHLFGGSCGDYVYTTQSDKPYVNRSFVNFRPAAGASSDNKVTRIFGGSKGVDGYATGTEKDLMQKRSYVLINIPSGLTNFAKTDVFGSGEASGLGMFTAAATLGRDAAESDKYSAIVDLISGRVQNVYGASYNEGITRRTVVNVPAGSTIWMDQLFGGGYGRALAVPCDTYESNVNWSSSLATVGWYQDGIFGGNNNSRRTLYARVNINSPVYSVHPHDQVTEQFATVYGAGLGVNTWCEYTEVNLNNGANMLYEVYGGGKQGRVLNLASVQAFRQAEINAGRQLSLDLTTGYTDEGLTSDLARNNGLGIKTNTNVWINSGAVVSGYMYDGALSGAYAYAGGLGNKNDLTDVVSGSVCGTTYIGLHGGYVAKDIYAGGTNGSVMDHYNVGTYNGAAGANDTIAQTYAYIEGGTVRNVYGGGWRGSVGYHDTNNINNDIPGKTNVIIGKLNANNANSYANGKPSVTRNVYGGGEGGQIYGLTNLVIYDGMIGYRYNSGTGEYDQELDDAAVNDNLLATSGNAFGGGYVANSSVDESSVRMYGGQIRTSLYGGGEIATIGRGRMNGTTPEVSKYGTTYVRMYAGTVLGSVFGGGRGEDNWGGNGYMTDEEKTWMDLSSRGYVFGKTRVWIHGGQIGDDVTVAKGEGNVFGGGNLGYVYGENVKGDDGYYYEDDGTGHASTYLTEDCSVIIEPECLVLQAFDSYEVGDRVDAAYMNTLGKTDAKWKTKIDDTGITIGNAVFAGGNVARGSDRVFANTPTVFGNATVSVKDIFARDFITIGEDGIGGLYGDGNLTLVDGYRELNITNYGTDYYNLKSDLSYTEYSTELNKRQKAYYELKYWPKGSDSNSAEQVSHTYTYKESLYLHEYTYTDDENKVQTVLFRRGQKITQEQYISYKIGQDNDEVQKWRDGSKTYRYKDQITENEFDLMDDAEKENWDLYGFCTLYLGRMMNTIQRADFCGVFGSRVVMRGALDRATDVADYTNYTINRVDEVSLNKSEQSGTGTEQGNYFGIYSVVNYLGALTSDVFFNEKRVTTSSEPDYKTPITIDNVTYNYNDAGATFYNWKLANINARKRNNGTSRNQVALASGVWLEIVDKETEQHKDTKTYGPITGVIELDLISVTPGEGGGYVYARNDHQPIDWDATIATNLFRTRILAAANQGAVSREQLKFVANADPFKMQTTGNFISSKKRIIDDCYPTSGAYSGASPAPAHYWYIKGDYYVYEQTISAYTGSALAYPEKISIPLTVTPESRGRLKLNSVEDNLSAYWEGEVLPAYQSTEDTEAIVIRNKLYHKNDPVSYWDWYLMTDNEKAYFTDSRTYICSHEVTLNVGGQDRTYTAGEILTALPVSNALDLYVCVEDFDNYVEGDVITSTVYDQLSRVNKNKFVRPFNPTNAVDRENGFLLTFSWDNPDEWNTHYQYKSTAPNGTPQVIRSDNSVTDYYLSPTFKCINTGLYGQRYYSVEDIIDEESFTSEPGESILNTYSVASDQASFEKVWMAKETFSYTDVTGNHEYQEGALISNTKYLTMGANQSKFTEVMVCVNTYEVSKQENYLNGLLYPVSTYNDLITAAGSDQDKIDAINSSFSYAYICTSAGAWGGSEYVAGSNYPALKYSNLTKSERDNFVYNYDAFDLLSEDFVPEPETEELKYYQGNKTVQGQPVIPVGDQIPYAEERAIDYKATFHSSTSQSAINLLAGQSIQVLRGGNPVTLTGVADNHTDNNRIIDGDVLTNTVYESALINEAYNYSPIIVTGTDASSKVYHVVKENFNIGNDYYTVGQVIDDDTYAGLDDSNHSKFINVNNNSLPNKPSGNDTKNYYFCTKEYSALTEVEDIEGNTISAGSTVSIGTILDVEDYSDLKNQQKGFSIEGKIPTSVSTLYVSRETDINKLSQDKIVTLVYLYEYIESDENGTSYETVRERHIVNIRVKFESGLPMVSELSTPSIVLPGSSLSLRTPEVTKGAFEPLGGGWEIFRTEDDALSHKHGSEFTVNNTPIYWYQDSAWIAYYSLSYLGKSYSNPVSLSVANYHRLADVMASTHEVVTETIDPNTNEVTRVITNVPDYMYLNMAQSTGRRLPKVYIGSSSELAQLAQFFNTSKGWEDDPEYGSIYHLDNIDFILDRDINYQEQTAWSPIASRGNNDTESCFAGNLHGDGHTISGLTESLFDYLCGNVYNLGVTGSFSTAGIANHGGGKVVNTWTYSTTSADVSGVNPIVGDGGGIVENSYYYNDYNSGTVAGHETYQMSKKDFMDGKVAYNLNGYYLNKRYYDEETPTTNNKTYQYWERDKVTATGNERTVTTSSYPNSYDRYVEHRYDNIDFTYAGGSIPETRNVRQLSADDKLFYPVYPDDYIFFGQTLTYGVGEHDAAHQSYPGTVSRTAGDKLLTGSNRVYRSPGYYGDSNMDLVHFNKDARFARIYDNTSVHVSDLSGRGLTAIDFTGSGDYDYPDTYAGNKDQSKFFSPILDYEGLSSFMTSGVTQNLLVYADKVNDATTHDNVLATALFEPTLSIDDSKGYGIVAAVSQENINRVKGHLVSKDGNNGYMSYRDHFLVDKQDFNAPISYQFYYEANGDKYYMWYQRTPDEFSDPAVAHPTDRYMKSAVVADELKNWGWQTISLPFTADLVSTQQKGELTHFYAGSNIGHEYWLRELGSVNRDDQGDVTGVFHSPTASGTATKTVTNQFLWDYYYSKNDRKDANSDLYKHYDGNDDPSKDYYNADRSVSTPYSYSNAREYSSYPLFTAGKPYLIGFPGNTYYEFDLSGQFVARNTYSGSGAETIGKLNKQTISFISVNGAEIGVTDTEYGNNKVTQTVSNGAKYTFMPSYQTESLATAGAGYLLNWADDAEGQYPSSKFITNTAGQSTIPFRPYFTYTAPSGAPQRAGTRADVLYIGYAGDEDGDPIIDMVTNHGLYIYSENMSICIESTLVEPADVTIHTTSGTLLKRLTVQPGTKEIVPVNSRGIYIVNRQKVAVTK